MNTEKIEDAKFEDIPNPEPSKQTPSKEKVSTSVAKLDDFTSVDQILATAKILLKSGLVPVALDTPEKIALVAMRGREVGFGAITSLENIYVINNRTTISVHGINAKLKEAGIAHKTIKDFEEFYTDIKDPKTGVVSKRKDYETVIRFYRYYPNLKMVIEEDMRFTYRDAEKAGLMSKEPWQKWTKTQTWNRCFTFGARRVGADYLLGMMETSEAADVENVNYEIVEGEVKIKS